MPKFRVELKEDHPVGKHGQPLNPFAIRDPFHAARRRFRVWEFEAKDEAEVRALYNDAKARDLENVRGFELHSITLMGSGVESRHAAASGRNTAGTGHLSDDDPQPIGPAGVAPGLPATPGHSTKVRS
jgi:hypothetical protein